MIYQVVISFDKNVKQLEVADNETDFNKTTILELKKKYKEKNPSAPDPDDIRVIFGKDPLEDNLSFHFYKIKHLSLLSFVMKVMLVQFDSLWSLKIPGCPSTKTRGVTPASWPNLPIGLYPSWPPNNPHILIGFITLSPLHQSSGVWWAFWRNMAAVASSGGAAHRWWLRRFPLPCKAL